MTRENNQGKGADREAKQDPFDVCRCDNEETVQPEGRHRSGKEENEVSGVKWRPILVSELEREVLA